MSIKREIEKAMTVGELKRLLNEFDDSMPVFCQYPSHDFWHTVLASSVQEVSMTKLTWSEYHNSPQVKDDFDNEYEKAVLIL